VIPAHSDEQMTLWHGDALAVLRELDDGSVDCCVTSPPYFGLRDYGVAGQYGLEDTPAEYVEQLRLVFAEVRRVLADDGTLWVNLGDAYAGRASAGPTRDSHRGGGHKPGIATAQRNMLEHAPYKSLLGMPWRVALALVDDGWALRNDVIWTKSNAMPESVTDRMANRHEHVFLFAKSARYWFDLDAVREPRKREHPPVQPNSYGIAISGGEHDPYGQQGSRFGGNAQSMHTTGSYQTDGRNPGDVWTIATQPFPEAHFATMPPALAERCILAGCRPGGVVLDPFSGSGTTGLAASRHGRRYVGIDLNRSYLELSLRTRLAQTALIDGGCKR
jgi:DNA modification methylase